MSSILCYNASAPVVQLVRASDRKSEDSGSNPGWISMSFFADSVCCCLATSAKAFFFWRHSHGVTKLAYLCKLHASCLLSCFFREDMVHATYIDKFCGQLLGVWLCGGIGFLPINLLAVWCCHVYVCMHFYQFSIAKWIQMQASVCVS